MSYLIFDLETIPDHSIWSPPPPEPARLSEEKKPGKAALEFLALAMESDIARLHPADIVKAHDIAVRAAKADAVAKFSAALTPEKPPFPPLYAHRPVAIGYLWFGDAMNVQALGCAGTSTYGDDEKRLLAEWGGFIGREKPAIVGWNSRTFDMPVITLRSFRHGVQQGWFTKEYRHRYNEDWHLDLMDMMTEFGAAGRAGYGLDDVAKLIGLPGKTGDGARVEELFKTSPAAVEAYCQSDVALTAFIFLRFMLVRGRIELAHYRDATRALVETCRGVPALAPLVSQVDTRILCLEEL